MAESAEMLDMLHQGKGLLQAAGNAQVLLQAEQGVASKALQ